MLTDKKSIMVIDDDPDIVEFLRYNLNGSGYEVSTATSGLHAMWKIALSTPPDLILLDIMMPSPDGYEVLEYLKDSEFRNVPVIIVSARTTENDIDRAYALGADYFLPKPFSIERLLELAHQTTRFSSDDTQLLHEVHLDDIKRVHKPVRILRNYS